jgi:hypothetical protein
MERGPSLARSWLRRTGLAVDGDPVERIGPAGADPVHEAGGEQVRIDPVDHDIEPASRGNSPVERQEPPQELEIGASPTRYGLEAVALGDRGANAQQPNLVQLCEPRLPDSVCPRSGKRGPAEAATAKVAQVRTARPPSAGSESGAPMDSAFPQYVNPANPSSEPWEPRGLPCHALYAMAGSPALLKALRMLQ